MEKNFYNSIQKIEIDTLINRVSQINNWENLNYVNVYNELLKFVSHNAKERDKNALIGIAHLVYGWMPTILKKCDYTNYSDQWWANIDNGSLDEKFLIDLAEYTNQSIIGVSKLLHFINPKMYAIWDSRVFNTITSPEIKRQTPERKEVNSASNYKYYIERLRVIGNENNNKLEELRKILIDKKVINQDTTSLRMLEISLFLKIN